jgi:hypothetical protein
MKYTRYDIRKKRSNHLALGFVLIGAIVFTFLVGTFISKIFTQDSGDALESVKPQETSVNQNNNAVSRKSVKYIAVQGGMFEKAENIDRSKTSLAAYGNPFTIPEQNATRVFLGIYNEEEGMKTINMLKEKNIESSRMVFELNTANNPCNEEIAAIISAELEILSKLNDKTIKSIQTEDLKKWMSSLAEVDKNSKNISLLNELKTHITNLPKELEKSKVSECYTFIYNTIKKVN